MYAWNQAHASGTRASALIILLDFGFCCWSGKLCVLRIHSRRCLLRWICPSSLTGSYSPIFFSSLGLMVTLVTNQVSARQGERIFRLPFPANHSFLRSYRDGDGSLSWSSIWFFCSHGALFVIELWDRYHIICSIHASLLVVVYWGKAFTWLFFVFNN